MKKYEEPKMEVIEMETVDVLCSSNGGGNKGGLLLGSYNGKGTVFSAYNERVH